MKNDIYPVDIEILHSIKNKYDDNVDVQVVLSDGCRYTATFFTLKNVEGLMRSYEATGECLSGAFFWAKDMILVKEITQEEITRAVWELVRTGEVVGAMSRADSYEEQ